MFTNLKEIERKFNICFDEKYTDYILKIFNGQYNEDTCVISHDAIKLNICGMYHRHITKNYAEMEKYYLRAIELGDADAMNHLGVYHHIVTNNYVEMEKYFLMAIELGNADAMNHLGVYHHQVTNNYVEMEKYFLMAIELGNAKPMSNLGVYHHQVTKNYAKMEKYYLMAIELGHADAMYNLGLYHYNVTKNYAEMEKYYLMAIELGNADAMSNLKRNYISNIGLFNAFDEHFNSKLTHTDAFMDKYNKLLEMKSVKVYNCMRNIIEMKWLSNEVEDDIIHLELEPLVSKKTK